MKPWVGRVVRQYLLPEGVLARLLSLGLAMVQGLVWIPGASGQESVPLVKTSHPTGSIHSANYPLSISLIFGQQVPPQDSVELWLNGVNVTSSTQFKASPFTWQLELALNLSRESLHTYEVRVHEAERADFTFSAMFFTDVRGAGDFLIEAEDFNYAQGRFRAAAGLPGYAGGAYEGLGAIHGVDYHQTNPTNMITDNYRQGEERNVTILYSDKLERSGYDLNSSWIVVGGKDDWFNYTRTFPTGYYQIYAAVSGTPNTGNLEGTLSRVLDAQSAAQTTSAIGIFESTHGEGWGENRLLPLVASETKVPKLVRLAGTETVRYSVGQGALDYLIFVPEFPISLTSLSRNRVQLNWTGPARLEEASDPAGPWEEKGTNLEPPLELVLPEGPSRGFYRLSRRPAPASLPSAVHRTP